MAVPARGAPPRAFRRAGLLGRLLPFAFATLAGFVLLDLLGPRPDGDLLVLVAAYVAALTTLVVVVPWERLPRWTDLLPPFALAGLIVLVRRRFVGLEALGVGPFFVIPMLWVALHGARNDLWIFIGVAVAARIVPGLTSGFEEGELGYALGGLMVSSVACLVIQRVVFEARDGERNLRNVLDGLPVGFAVSKDGIIRYANYELASNLKSTPSDLMNRAVVTLVAPTDRAAVTGHLRGDDLASTREVRMPRRDGSEATCQLRSVAITFDGTTAIGLTLRDIGDERRLDIVRREAQAALESERELLRVILSNIDDAVAIIDREHQGVFANLAYLRFFDFTPEQFVGMTREEFMARASERVEAPNEFLAQFGDQPDSVIGFRLPRRSLQRRLMRPVSLPTGEGWLVIWRDVTAQSDLVSQLAKDGFTDSLTGVLNRRGALEVLHREVSRSDRAFSVAMIDVDNFKAINDRYGHEAGDRVLRALADTLVGQARATDLVSRWGGEEFLVIVPTGKEGARRFCERVRAALRGSTSHLVPNVTISAGVAEHVDGELIERTIGRADERLYDAKRNGRDRVDG